MNQQLEYNQAFRTALNNLNIQQRQAVETIDGPVLVVAGPGTGKTQILAARIGKILLDTDTDARNILCLTFTEAGAINMRKRLFDFIGPDAYRVNIYTFHAFCNEVIQENLEYFGKINLDPISDLEEAELLKELIDEFNVGNPLKRFTGEVYFEKKRLKNLFKLIKKEDWQPESIEKKIDEYLTDLPFREEFIYKKKTKHYNAGDLKVDKIAEETQKMEMLRAAVKEYAHYQAKMRARNRYDFDDMIVWVLDAFKNDANLLARYQEQFQYILVDEYQDTSGAQNELLQHLIADREKPDVFVVGDDDQSIFRFQGANMSNILDFAFSYKNDLNTIVLTQNYRSTQAILDASKVLIDNNLERLTKALNLDKNLTAANAKLASFSIVPQIHEYQNQDHELIGVATQIISLLEDGVGPDEIAVIFRNHNQAEALANYLAAKEVPVNIKRKLDILTLPFVDNIINILRYLAMEMDTPYSGDDLLFEIMHYDFFNIPSIETAKISVEVFRKNYSFGAKADDSVFGKTSIRRWIADLAQPKKLTLFDQQTSAEIKKLSQDLEFWIKESKNLTLQELFEKIILRAGILKYIMHSKERNWNMQVLTNLFDFLKEENRKNPDLKIEDFVRTIELMKQNDIRLELNKTLFAEKGVHFMTAHGSKGLEFEYVFLVGCNTKVWDTKQKAGGTKNYKYPDNLTTKVAEGSELEESRRLFYVALTRAKHSLYVSFAAEDKKGKALEHSQFIAEMRQGLDLPTQHKTVNEDALFDYIATQFNEEEKPKIELIDKNYLDLLLQNYTLSVTHLSSYLDCPLRFYFQNLIRVPSGKSPSATFGLAIHWALNKMYIKMHETNAFPGEDFLFDQFSWFMYRNRESFTKDDFKLRMEYGRKIIPPYYVQYAITWNKVAVTERSIKNVVIDNVPIKGNLDKMEFNGKQINVVDYKTGKYKNAKAKFSRPDEKNPTGGDYWRQAVFYKILVDNDKSNDWEVVSTEFDFVEPIKDNEYHKEKIVITPDDIEFVKAQINETHSKIMNHEFSQGCGKEDCHWCNFVRSNFEQQEVMIGEEEI
ncbi:ATP-dependent helicase [Solitalea koreensis]|uniref:DNA 3'-5' helicase n=1 Tax=Solitalea koreensis TaxID=543615 RepID=A0A521AYR3_9SPHI|nr:ATP-dependent DNA helicase [Solitalea koreensis]SMO39901.1 DNA helicase-2 / ATP-dependent DNA helicase PcrA [Solitalea koreensis]